MVIALYIDMLKLREVRDSLKNFLNLLIADFVITDV